MTQTGPRSPEAKQRVSTNAVKHGLRSTKVVIPGLEIQSDWDTFVKDSIKALDPQGAIEYALAERIATLLWRLRRAPRAERDSAILANKATVEKDDPQFRATQRFLESYRAQLIADMRQRERDERNGRDERDERDRSDPQPPSPAEKPEYLRAPAVLPEPLQLQNLSQYEYRLSRQLVHAMRELQALQDRRPRASHRGRDSADATPNDA